MLCSPSDSHILLWSRRLNMIFCCCALYWRKYIGGMSYPGSNVSMLHLTYKWITVVSTSQGNRQSQTHIGSGQSETKEKQVIYGLSNSTISIEWPCMTFTVIHLLECLFKVKTQFFLLQLCSSWQDFNWRKVEIKISPVQVDSYLLLTSKSCDTKTRTKIKNQTPISVKMAESPTFKGLVILTQDRVILHTVMHHSSTYTPNFIEME